MNFTQNQIEQITSIGLLHEPERTGYKEYFLSKPSTRFVTCFIEDGVIVFCTSSGRYPDFCVSLTDVPRSNNTNQSNDNFATRENSDDKVFLKDLSEALSLVKEYIEIGEIEDRETKKVKDLISGLFAEFERKFDVRIKDLTKNP